MNYLLYSQNLEIFQQVADVIYTIKSTDMENYKIIRKNQFACSTMQVRRDGKMPVALLKDMDEAIISQAYPVFEITDTLKILPEYLMMWFSRAEFDREACFYAIGGVRGSLEWDDFCDMQLPVPAIEKQKEIVAEYKTITNRMGINNRLIQKLEETAQAIYKQWFVDFEFPDEEGKPYKSNGGEMLESEMGEMPKGWRVIAVNDFCIDMKSGGTPSRDDMSFWDSNDVPWLKTGEIHNNIILETEEYISQKGLESSSAKILPKDTVLMAMYGATAGQLGILKFETCTNQACCGMICKSPEHSVFLYFSLLQNQDYISSQAIGGAQENLSKNFIENISLIVPTENLINKKIFKNIIDYKEKLTVELINLIKVEELLLAKMVKN